MSFLAFGLYYLITFPGTAVAYSCGEHRQSPKSTDCTIVVVDTLRFDDIEDISFECILDPVDSGRNAETRVPIRTSAEQNDILHAMYNKGEIISEWSTLLLDQDMQVSHEGIFIPMDRTAFHIAERSSYNGDRRLVATEGDKPFLLVKVIDSEGRKLTESADQISDDIFGTYGDQMTLKSQMNACSYGKVDIIAGINDEHEVSPGVIEVTIDKSLVGNSRSVIRTAVIEEVQLLLGHSLPGPYSHVMFVLEGCYTGEFAEIYSKQLNVDILMSTNLNTITPILQIVVGLHMRM